MNNLRTASGRSRTGHDLKNEISEKIKKGYALTSTIFEKTKRAVLFQGKRKVFEFTARIPELAHDLREIINVERQQNKRFFTAFTNFAAICRTWLDPNLSDSVSR